MCYALPGPRCSGHAAENLAKAKTNLEQAMANHEQKIEALSDAKSDKAKAEFFASQKLLAEAEKAVEVAQKEQDAFEVKHQAAKDAYKLAERDWYTTPDGIQELRDEADKAMSEGRTDDAMAAEHKANQFQKRRDGLIRKMKAEEAKKNANLAPAVTATPEFSPMEPMPAEWQKHVETHLSKLNESDAWSNNINKSKAFQNMKRLVWDREAPQAGLHQIATGVTKYRTELLEVMTLNENLHAETVDYIVRNSSVASFRYADHPNIAESTSDYLVSKGDTNVFKNKSLSPEQLKKYSKSEDSTIRGYVALHENTPDDVRDELSNDPSAYVRSAVARTSTSREVLRKLATDSDVDVLQNVAGNEATGARVLESMAGDTRGSIPYYLIDNPKITPKALEAIAQADDMQVRSRVARYHRIPASVQKQLVRDGSYEVRISLAGNKKVSQETVEALRSDKSKKVRDAVAKR